MPFLVCSVVIVVNEKGVFAGHPLAIPGFESPALRHLFSQLNTIFLFLSLRCIRNDRAHRTRSDREVHSSIGSLWNSMLCMGSYEVETFNATNNAIV